ncbi:uncharacterized protein LOC125838318 [Solanum verrucosum]|uniref:uncharacterized protein LOC125838318 n=1 Tax=Solanum verrucosum TaxID=315347 RepID=UPI0020D02169|nr:uncharacterized protein LOC125838318 [Solanum verrucosum]
MEGESSNTYEDFEEDPLPTDPNWLVIPQLRGNIGRMFASEQSAFDMNSDELDALSITVQDISISKDDKPRPAPVVGHRFVPEDIIETLPTVYVEDDKPDDLCPICNYGAEKGEQWLQLPCKHILHIDCGRRLLARKNACPTCNNKVPVGDAVYDGWISKEKEDREEKEGYEKSRIDNKNMYI